MTEFFLRDLLVIAVANFCLLFPKSHILFSKVEKGKLKTVLACGNTTRISKGSYWPASTIKILPAIAVLRKGIDPRTYVKMKRYKGTVRTLLKRALGVSSNKAYDSLVDLVGRDYVNTTAKQLGLKHTWISRAYGRHGHFRHSAGYWLGKKYIQARRAKLKNPNCSSNCTSLEDLQKMILYVSQNKELRRWTHIHSPQNKFAKIVKRFYSSAQVYCKGGYVAYHHGLDNCKLGDHILSIAIPCGSWKDYKKNKNKRARIAEILLFYYGNGCFRTPAKIASWKLKQKLYCSNADR